MKILIVVNPISGGVNKEPFLRHLDRTLKTYGIKNHVFKTTGKNDQIELQKILKSYHPDRVLSLGGDGTTLFTAQNLLETECPFGIIPLGSANGMSTELGVSSDPKIALDDFLKSHMVRGLDLILVNERYYCLHIGDIGLNSRIVEEFSKDKERGMLTYAKHFIKEIEKAPLIKFSIEMEGETIYTEGYMLAIANSRKYGTGVVLNYYGNPLDGQFELVVVKKIDNSTLLRAGLSKFNEHYAKDNQVETIKCSSKVTVKFDSPKTLQLDGEIIGEMTGFEARVLPSVVNLITSTNNPFVEI